MSEDELNTHKELTNSALLDDSEERAERALRPLSMSEFIGREREKANLRIMIDSATKRSQTIDHVLFHGPPGLGKTSLAMLIAKEMGATLHITTGPAITKSGDLASMLTSLDERSILFIDEIHRLNRQVEEILYPAMEDRVIDIVIGKGPAAKTLRIDLPPFTIIGATTRLSLLSAPLRDRFGIDFRLDFYNDEELKQIVEQKAQKLELNIEPDAAMEIAKRARMTARIAVRLLKRVRDMAVVEGEDTITVGRVKAVLSMLDIDELGLDVMDRKILQTMYTLFTDRPVGLSTLAASVSEDTATIEEVYEPFLLRAGLLERTPRGRLLTGKAIKYLSERVNT